MFVCGGYFPSVAYCDAGEAILLSFLEAIPLAAGLMAVPVVLPRSGLRWRLTALVKYRRLSALRTVDAFAIVYVALLTLVYLPRLSLHATITVRYQLPVFPIVLYGLLRFGSVRRVLEEQTVTSGFAYLGGVLIGGQQLVVYL